MKTRAWLRHGLQLGGALLLLLALTGVYASGQTLLAAVLLAAGVLALWTYSSPRSGALRYLFPGVAAALVFVIFPMLYTLGLGFSNYSARNLLDFERARELLLEERLQVPASQREFSLHSQGDGGLRLRLIAGEDEKGGEGGPSLLSPVFRLDSVSAQDLTLSESHSDGVNDSVNDSAPLGRELSMAERVPLLPGLRQLSLLTPQGQRLSLSSLREFAQSRPLFELQADGSLRHTLSGQLYRPDAAQGFFTGPDGEQLQPGYRVNVGWRHFARIFGDSRFRAPFLSVFAWTVMFSALTVISTAALGLLLAVLLNWQSLECRAAYRLVLFLPYAVPGFISILVFKGLFNQNLGEVNLILHGLFGIKPAWFSDPLLAKTMLLIVNLWLGFPYMMVLCSGLIQSIPSDLYEASAVAGAGPWDNFRLITLPLILKPLTPLLISAFAFNFNNFVLISLLTGGRPDQLDTSLPAGTTDILVSYTWRIAFQDSGQQFGLASAISTLIFLIVAAITLVQMRLTRINDAKAS
ncbi:maltose ABC transporter permease MalF [Paucibacter sp. KBW04]|uniref:maltose ABC transporter permease MalF n=1 Tax=Paucibacter sp. KBW04 TaxID=2153361 RepID=UPI000F56DDEE|nr:maltose ABC transporter permease MalF [Paucibacter sp. KBW04]RQO62072.1 maltose ABC transporter permease MalF [Paucibacter sp. KBW04]